MLTYLVGMELITVEYINTELIIMATNMPFEIITFSVSKCPSKVEVDIL